MEKVIHYILSHDDDVTDIVASRIFPVFADWQASVERTTGTLKPLIIYHRDDTQMEIDIAANPQLQVGLFI